MIYNNTANPTIENVIMSAIANALADTHTNLLAKVTRVNSKTIDCKPVISKVVNKKKIDLPTFIEVPVINFLGGSSSIQMPIEVGDYCILFVSERCFDNWYSGKDFERPLEVRFHDYSDSVALVGLKNKNGELDIPTVITILGDTKTVGNWNMTGDIDILGDVNIVGNLNVTGNIGITQGDLTVDGISFKNHVHPQNDGNELGGGVDTGTSK